MCGIVGLFLKQESMRTELGKMLVPMFVCMAERGPDSAGLAVFREPVLPNLRRYSLFSRNRAYPWDRVADSLRNQTGTETAIHPLENHAVVISSLCPPEFAGWLREYDPSLHLLSVGRSIEIYKDEGDPKEVARRYNFARLNGSHAIGHTRMATESAVSPAHAHPFTAGEDFCLVHNGSLSNPHMLRRKLEAEGLHFETDNDTEAACRFIEWRMRFGDTLDEALQVAFQELDGFYTLLIATSDQITLVRDAFACKPAVVAETESYVAISSEFRSLAHLPGVADAQMFEPLPEEIYSWRVR
jgi:glutamate synthase domain-containing protein 1